METEITVAYRAASAASDDAVYLVTERRRGPGVHFDGYVVHAAPAARALLCVAQVASSRFFQPAAMIAARLDPVVTAEPARLRFESFSQCAGVHARFDLVEDGIEVRECSPGTTNVDFNAPLRSALSRIAGRDPLRVTVGHDAVAVHTLDGSIVERRVPLPERWVKGFGEVQVALMRTSPVLELGHAATRRFLDGLPGGRVGKATAWAVPTAGTLRLAHSWQPGAVCLAGTSRLRVLQPLARYATGLRAYGEPDVDAPSTVAWVLTLPGGRIGLTLSPEASRGFSGEGGLLMDLASQSAARDAQSLSRTVAGRPRFTLEDAAAAGELPRHRAAVALTWLGVHGHLGFDVVDHVFFRRHLPYPEELLRSDPPRLRDARALVDAGAVDRRPDGGWRITSGAGEYRASLEPVRCSCPWWARHGLSRGPCKHVLAAAIVRDARTDSV